MKQLLVSVLVFLSYSLNAGTMDTIKTATLNFLGELAVNSKIKDQGERARANRGTLEKYSFSPITVDLAIEEAFDLSAEEVEGYKEKAPRAYAETRAIFIERYIDIYEKVFRIADTILNRKLQGQIVEIVAAHDPEFAAMRNRLLNDPIDVALVASSIEKTVTEEGIFYQIPVIAVPEHNDTADFSLVVFHRPTKNEIRVIDLIGSDIMFRNVMIHEMIELADRYEEGDNRFERFVTEAKETWVISRDWPAIEALID